MKLYHFTDFANLKSEGTILRDGLLIPKPEPGDRMYVKGIWLTANPEPVCWLEGGSFDGQCRITVEIPKTDRRLRQCKAHLAHVPPLHDLMQRTSDENGVPWEDWYFFFGNIRVKRFRAIDYGDPQERAKALAEVAAGTWEPLSYQEMMRTMQ